MRSTMALWISILDLRRKTWWCGLPFLTGGGGREYTGHWRPNIPLYSHPPLCNWKKDWINQSVTVSLQFPVAESNITGFFFFFLPLLLRRDEFFIPNSTGLSVWENALGPRDFQTPTVSMATFWINIDRWAVNADWSLSSWDCKTTYVQFIWCLLVLYQTWYMLSCMLSSSLILSLLLWGSHSVFQ